MEKCTIDFLVKKITKCIHKLQFFFNDNYLDITKIKVNVERNKNIEFADFSTNVILLLGLDKYKSQQFSNLLIKNLPKKYFKTVILSDNKFLNFSLTNKFYEIFLKKIIKQGDGFGIYNVSKKSYEIEFVSANPTGLLHIGHARNAAIGDTLARIWESRGIRVVREYYINDSGNQIEKLAISVLVRYKQLFGIDEEIPEDGYHGEEIKDVANKLRLEVGNRYIHVECTEDTISSKHDQAKEHIKDFSKTYLLNVIKETLIKFGVNMDVYFPESFLYKKDLIKKTIDNLGSGKYLKDNATWLQTTRFGDDKDRVLIKSDGSYTYFAPDIAYHNIKLSRGYDKIFNIWGADHKSYADRMRIAMELMGHNKNQLEILIMQMVRLIKDGQEFKMSKRSGQSLTLADLLATIGKDSARWYLISKAATTHLEIDVGKATSKNNENQLYYVQYANARINQLLTKTRFEQPDNFDLLNSKEEREIITMLMIYNKTLNNIVISSEVNKLTLYIYSLAKLFHSYYANNKIIDHQALKLSQQRCWLVKCVKQVICNGLKLMTIVPLEKM